MARYIGWRLLALIPTVIGVVTVVFLLLRLIPGDPAEFILGDYATKENLARLRASSGVIPLTRLIRVIAGNFSWARAGRTGPLT